MVREIREAETIPQGVNFVPNLNAYKLEAALRIVASELWYAARGEGLVVGKQLSLGEMREYLGRLRDVAEEGLKP